MTVGAVVVVLPSALTLFIAVGLEVVARRRVEVVGPVFMSRHHCRATMGVLVAEALLVEVEAVVRVRRQRRWRILRKEASLPAAALWAVVVMVAAGNRLYFLCGDRDERNIYQSKLIIH
jgi:hypothetical protein